MHKPKVSIVIPVYNGGNFLADAIESALAQTYENLEVIVVNDGSDDNGETESIVKRYESCIRYFRKKNGGVSSALNLAIENMSGEYFSWLSHDDLYMPDKISSQIDYIESSTDHACEILYSDYCLFHQGTGQARNVVLENDRPAGFRSRLFFSNDVHGCTLLIPKSAFDKVGFFDESLKAVQDYDMWFRLATHFKFTRIPQVLVRGRVHEGQLGTQVPWRIAENRQLRESWIDKLTPTEVHMYTEKPDFISFYNAALHFGKRGFLYLSFRCFSRASKANSGFTSYQLPGAVLSFAYSFAYGFAYILYRDLKYKFIKVFS